MSLTCIQDVSEPYYQDGYLWKDLPKSHFWEIYGQCTKVARVTNVSQILVSRITSPFSGCLQTGIQNRECDQG